MERVEYNMNPLFLKINDMDFSMMDSKAKDVVEYELITDNQQEVYLDFRSIIDSSMNFESFLVCLYNKLLHDKRVKVYCLYHEKQEELIKHFLKFKGDLNPFYVREINLMIE